MRQVMTGLALGSLLLLSGCSGFNPRPRPDGGGGGGVARQSRWDGRQPTAAYLVGYLNETTAQMQALSCERVDLDCTADGQSGSANGRLDCQKPRNFRLTARVVGQPLVDIGSNDQEFWYWISKANPPYVVHCSHEALNRGGIRMPFPFQPDMVLAALGMTECDPRKQYDVRVNAQTVELLEPTRSPRGDQVYKVTVFQRSPASGDQPQVVAHLLRDPQGREICRATVTQVTRDSRTGVELPRRIQFDWPEHKIKLKMKLDGMRIVPPNPELTASLYSRRNLASQPAFDLERMQPDSPTGHVQRVGVPPR
jgi:hypothetical protein